MGAYPETQTFTSVVAGCELMAPPFLITISDVRCLPPLCHSLLSETFWLCAAQSPVQCSNRAPVYVTVLLCDNPMVHSNIMHTIYIYIYHSMSKYAVMPVMELGIITQQYGTHNAGQQYISLDTGTCYTKMKLKCIICNKMLSLSQAVCTNCDFRRVYCKVYSKKYHI